MAHKNIQLKNRVGDLLYPRTKVSILVDDNGQAVEVALKSEIPTKVSELQNDSGFITKSVNDLANYYLKTETYTKSEVDALISAIEKFTVEVVTTNPETWDQTELAKHLNKIILYKPEGKTIYIEYIVIDKGSSASPRYILERIGDTDIKLENYYTKSEVDGKVSTLNTAIEGKVSKVTGNNKIYGTDETGAQTAYDKDSFGKIDDVKVNGTSVVTNKIANIDISGKVDKETGKGLSTNDYTTAEKNKLGGIEAGAEVNIIEKVKLNGSDLTPDASKRVDLGNLATSTELSTLAGRVTTAEADIDALEADSHTHSNKTILDGIVAKNLLTDEQIAEIAKVQNKADKSYVDTEVAKKVDKVENKSLVADSEITKLAGVSEGANKVEASTDNGYIKIDGTKTKVYEEVANTVHDANYKHITVTTTSVSDGTTTFNKYDDTAIQSAISGLDTRMGTAEGEIDALQTTVGDSSSGLVRGLADEITRATNAESGLGTRLTTAEGNISTISSDYLKAADKTELNTAISNEASARSDADTALENRIEALEGRGRYLSGWNAATGLPTDYPTIPETETGLSYTYTYKTGDYYIISNVPAEGADKYMPNGSSITATRTSTTAAWTWTVGKKKTTDEITVNDNYIYSTSAWTLFHTPTKEVVWGSIGGTLSEQTDLKNALDAKQATIDASHKLSADLVQDGSTNHVFTAADDTKLAGIAAGAQVNVLEGVQVNGVDLTITNKKVNVDISGKVDKVSGKSLIDDSKITKLDGIEAGAQVNKIETIKVGSTALEITDKTVNLETVAGGALATKDEVTKSELGTSLKNEIEGKVDKVTGKSLVSDSEITKLAGVSTGANKVTVATPKSGSIEIDGVSKQVIPDNIAIDANYKHITVTSNSVSDGTTTFTKYDDTALANRVSTLETKVSNLEDTVGDSTSGLVKDVADLKTTVGNSSSGLVKGLANEIKRATDAESALDGRLDTLEALSFVVYEELA